MEKFLDLNKYSVEKLKREDLIIYKKISATILDMPVTSMMETLKNMFQELVEYTNKANVFFNIAVQGNATVEDIDDLYDYIENALTDVFANNLKVDLQTEKDKEIRLGTYGLPQVNMKNINYMKWINGHSSLSGIGFKVYKHGSHWSRRMIKK